MKLPAFNTHKKMVVVMALLVSAIGIITTAFTAGGGGRAAAAEKDSAASVKAFMQVYRVLMSPRCLNCHPAGDVPLQGNDSHLHGMMPQRGPDGRGLYAMKCTNCHQPANAPGQHTPPGNANWHLPPADMKMVFEGRTPTQLARQLIDPKQNGHKTLSQLLEHAHDDLVKWAWNPGEGRTTPPIPHEEFVKYWNTWIEKGAFAPPATPAKAADPNNL